MQFRQFCFCLPLRIGVIILTVLAIISGGGGAILLWISLGRLVGQDGIQSEYKAAVGVCAGMYTVLAFIAAFGLVGAIRRNITLVKMFRTLSYVNLVFNIAAGAFAIHAAYQADDDAPATKCTYINEEISCTYSNNRVSKVSVMVAFTTTMAIQISECLLVQSFVKELEEENQRGFHPTDNIPLVDGGVPMEEGKENRYNHVDNA